MRRASAALILCLVVSLSALAAAQDEVPGGEPASSEAAAATPDSAEIEFDVVGLAAVLGTFGAPILIVVTISLLQYRKQRQLQETLRLMIEKGTEIPPELLTPPDSPYKDLRRGLILVGIGLALVLLIGLTDGFAGGAWAVGLIPGLIGVAYLIVWRLSRKEGSR